MSGDLVPPAVIRGVEVLRLPNNRVALAGRLPAISQLLEQLRGAGQLASMSSPAPDGRPGVYTVTVRLLPPASPAAAEPRRSRGARFWVAIAAVAGLTLAGVAWALVALIEAVLDAAGRAASAALPALLGLIVVLVGIAAVGSVRGGGGFSGTFRGKMD